MKQTEPKGYLAVPSSGKSPGVLVLHAWWGLNATTKTVCRRLANAGFVAFAPDLYHGRSADTIDDAEVLADALFSDQEPVRADLAAATTYLSERADQGDREPAVIGFSLGAYFALELSVTAPDTFRQVVVFYGTRPGDYTDARAAYLGHFAEEDPFEPQSSVDELEAALRRAGRPVTFYRYQDRGHWFSEPDRPHAYHPAAARLAWDRTMAFLKRYHHVP